MSDLDAALRRLEDALDGAEAAVGRALDAADVARVREQELTAFADDRLRLAELLDVSAEQSQMVETAREKADAAFRVKMRERLDAAIASVEVVLEHARG